MSNARLDSWLSQLDEAQRQAALSHPYEPLLISAGAGSGKTRVIMTRVAWLIESVGVEPNTILALSFTRKACQEMSDRIGKICDAGLVVIKTFHAFAFTICKDRFRFCFQLYNFRPITSDGSRELGFQYPPRILERNEQIELIKDSLLRLDRSAIQKEWPRDDLDDEDEEYGRDDDPLASAIAYFTSLIARSKRQNFDLSKYSGNDRIVLEYYEQRKKSQHSVDQDDLVPLVVRMLSASSSLREEFQQRHRYILVDEFQDVSPRQLELLKLLVPNGTSAACRSITVCGDQDQSIYGFLEMGESCKRVGLSRNNFDLFLQHWTGAKVVKLQRNYRATGNLVRATGALIAKNGISATSCACETKNDDGQKIVVLNAGSEEKEVQAVCEAIMQLRTGGILYQHICILYRVRSIGKSFQRELARRRIPTVNAAPDFSSGLYKKAIIIDILAYLQISLDAKDDNAFKRSVNRPNRGFGKQALDKLCAAAQRWKLSLWESAQRAIRYGGTDLTSTQKNGLLDHARIVNSLKTDYERLTPAEILKNLHQRIFGASAKRSGISTKAKPDDDPQVILQMIDEMINDLETFGANGDEEEVCSSVSVNGATSRTLFKYVSIVKSSSTGIKREKQREVVTLSTVHQAKGLEFSHVFLVRFNDSFFPLPLRARDGEDECDFENRRANSVKEERRLAYVAMSRAKVYLQVSWVINAMDGMIPSRFIEEIPSEFLQSKREAELAASQLRRASQSIKGTARGERTFAKTVDCFESQTFVEPSPGVLRKAICSTSPLCPEGETNIMHFKTFQNRASTSLISLSPMSSDLQGSLPEPESGKLGLTTIRSAAKYLGKRSAECDVYQSPLQAHKEQESASPSWTWSAAKTASKTRSPDIDELDTPSNATSLANSNPSSVRFDADVPTGYENKRSMMPEYDYSVRLPHALCSSFSSQMWSEHDCFCKDATVDLENSRCYNEGVSSMRASRPGTSMTGAPQIDWNAVSCKHHKTSFDVIPAESRDLHGIWKGTACSVDENEFFHDSDPSIAASPPNTRMKKAATSSTHRNALSSSITAEDSTPSSAPSPQISSSSGVLTFSWGRSVETTCLIWLCPALPKGRGQERLPSGKPMSVTPYKPGLEMSQYH